MNDKEKKELEELEELDKNMEKELEGLDKMLDDDMKMILGNKNMSTLEKKILSGVEDEINDD